VGAELRLPAGANGRGADMGLLLKEGMSSLVANGVNDNRIPPVETMELMAERLVADYRVFNASYHDTLIEPFPGIVEMLGALKQYGYRTGVVTSKRRDGAERGLGIFGLDQFIDCLIAADDTVEHNRFPRRCVKGIECLGSRPETAAYVGDSTHDMIAGRRAGVVTIAACWGPFVRAELEAINPDWLARLPNGHHSVISGLSSL